MYFDDDDDDDLRSWLLSTVLPRIIQLSALLVIPALFLLFITRGNSLQYYIHMGLESFGLNLNLASWWSSGSGSVENERNGKRSKRKHSHSHTHGVRTRAEQIALNETKSKSIADDLDEDDEDEGYYPGLVNISGTYCFMNSTLQALSSLRYLQPYIDLIHERAEALDVPSPVVDSLRQLFHTLNNPTSSYTSIRPLNIIDTLMHTNPDPDPKSKTPTYYTNSLLNSREHQDAQELFQLVHECIKNESAAVDKEARRDRGFGGLSRTPLDSDSEFESESDSDEGSIASNPILIGKSPFDGLTANRRSCMECGYTEALMHFPFDNWQLAVPRLAASCALEALLEDYTRLEVLTDCICRKCSMLATHKRLLLEAEKLAAAIAPGKSEGGQEKKTVSQSKKKRAKDVRKMEAKVEAAINQGRIEEELKDVRMEKVFSPRSTKQAMIARPPPILALHINRSVHYGQYASKNNIRIIFPEILDLTPYTTSGNLSTVPTAPISSPYPRRSTTPTPSTYINDSRTIYRLSAVVCHFGQHSFGHYICYRRKPRPLSTGERRWDPPKVIDKWDDGNTLVVVDDPTDDENKAEQSIEGQPMNDRKKRKIRYRPGKGWLRISDDSVRECGIESVLAEGSGAFMLYYERVVYEQERDGNRGVVRVASPRSSEETLKPKIVDGVGMVVGNGSVSSLESVGIGKGLIKGSINGTVSGRYTAGEKKGLGMTGPRVVRRGATGRSKSSSASAPSTRESSIVDSSPAPNTVNGAKPHLNGSTSTDPSSSIISDISEGLRPIASTSPPSHPP